MNQLEVVCLGGKGGCRRNDGPRGRRVVQLLRARDVQRELGISRTTIWRLVKAGEFPPPLRITSKVIAWRKSDIEEWQEQLADKCVDDALTLPARSPNPLTH